MAKQETVFELWLPPRQSGRSVYRWLYEGIIAAIQEGRLRPGSRVPSTRRLALEYGVARGSVSEAYEQLVAEGYLGARVGSGTRVNAVLPEALLTRKALRRAPQPRQSTCAARAVSARGKLLSARSHQVMAPLVPRAFMAHRPALDLFPKKLWAQTTARQLRKSHSLVLAEHDTFGYRPLREAIAGYLGSARGVPCAWQRIMVVSGLQPALDLTVRLLLDAGDQAWMEDPGYPRAHAVLRALGTKVCPVPADGEGIDVGYGRRYFPHARLAYVTPAHQAPLGVAMSLPRRGQLLAWAEQVEAWIFEDDYDSEYRYRGKPLPSLCGLDEACRVIHFGSFSKTLFPGLRLAYLVVPETLVDLFSAARSVMERFPPVIPQLALAEFIDRGHYATHLRRMRSCYGERHATLSQCMHAELSGVLRLAGQPAGLDAPAWIEAAMNEQDLVALARKQDIILAGLQEYAIRKPLDPGVVLGFAAIPPGQIAHAVRKLAQAIRRKN